MIKSGSVLVINCGSSSIKFSVVDHETSTHVIRGSVERISEENAQLKYTRLTGWVRNRWAQRTMRGRCDRSL